MERSKGDEQREVYLVVRGQSASKGFEQNITILFPRRLGQEFPKTFGHYHLPGEVETYKVLFGQAGLLIQKPESLDKSNKITKVQFLRGNEGDILKVPADYAHSLINLGNDFLITIDRERQSAGHNYKPIKNLRGFCYYVVEKEGKVKFVKNFNYTKVPKIKFTAHEVHKMAQSN